MTKTAVRIIEHLESLGVKRVYTLPGGFSMHLNDALNYSKLTPVHFLHEADAAWAAQTEAKYTNDMAVVLVTSGPGSTNIITPVSSAWQDSVPLLILSGDAKLPRIMARSSHQLRQGGAQDVDIEQIAYPITKYCKVMRHVNQLYAAIDLMMKPRRGPAWVSVPLDVQAADYE